MIGGFPTKYYFSPPGLTTDDWCKEEGFLMRLDSKTNGWKSEGNAGLPQREWRQKQYTSVTGHLQLLTMCKLSSRPVSPLCLQVSGTHFIFSCIVG